MNQRSKIYAFCALLKYKEYSVCMHITIYIHKFRLNSITNVGIILSEYHRSRLHMANYSHKSKRK